MSFIIMQLSLTYYSLGFTISFCNFWFENDTWREVRYCHLLVICCVFIVDIRHFSHVTKSHIFKNHNLKKVDRNFRRTFLKNRFRHLKFYSNPPSWLARGRCHMGTFWKTKDWSPHFWEVVVSSDERKQVSQKALRGEPNSSTGAISSF